MVEEGKVEQATEEIVEKITEAPPAEEETPEPPPEEEPIPKPPSPKVAKVDRGESFWSPKELASKMACTQSYIYLMIKQGKIKAVKQGRMVKISPEEVQKVLTDGLPLPPKPEPKVEAEEIVVEDPRITEKLKPPLEPTEEPELAKNKPGWPLSIFFK